MKNLVVCETVHAIVLHLREGQYQDCGKQDSDTLCGVHPAWDTQIPVKTFEKDEQGLCRQCRAAYLSLFFEKIV